MKVQLAGVVHHPDEASCRWRICKTFCWTRTANMEAGDLPQRLDSRSKPVEDLGLAGGAHRPHWTTTTTAEFCRRHVPLMFSRRTYWQVFLWSFHTELAGNGPRGSAPGPAQNPSPRQGTASDTDTHTNAQSLSRWKRCFTRGLLRRMMSYQLRGGRVRL